MLLQCAHTRTTWAQGLTHQHRHCTRAWSALCMHAGANADTFTLSKDAGSVVGHARSIHSVDGAAVRRLLPIRVLPLQDPHAQPGCR